MLVGARLWSQVAGASALAALAALAGCAPNGDDIANRLSTVAPASGAYRVAYLAPPWELIDDSGEEIFLRIPSNAMRFAGIDGAPARYELRVSTLTGEPSALARTYAQASRSAGRAVLRGPTAVSAGGVAGSEVLTEEFDPFERRTRLVFFPLDPRRSVRLAFEATPSLDTAEVDDMIARFRIGPAS